MSLILQLPISNCHSYLTIPHIASAPKMNSTVAADDHLRDGLIHKGSMG
jgi:hypothetical protein